MSKVPSKINPVPTPGLKGDVLMFVANETEFRSLTHLWTDLGGKWEQKPADFMTQRGQRLVDDLAGEFGVDPEDLLAYRDGVLWATPVVAKAYAGWVNVKFLLAYDKLASLSAKAMMQEMALRAPDRSRAKAIAVRETEIDCRNDLTDILKRCVALGPRKKDSLYGSVTNKFYVVITGQDADGWRQSHGLGGNANVRARLFNPEEREVVAESENLLAKELTKRQADWPLTRYEVLRLATECAEECVRQRERLNQIAAFTQWELPA